MEDREKYKAAVCDQDAEMLWHGCLHCLKMQRAENGGVPGHAAVCYLIAENTTDVTLIEKTALALMSAGCRDFHFCGKQRQLWHNTVDVVDIHRTSDEDDWALTSDNDNISDFADELSLEDLPDTYLIYDDEELLTQTLCMLEKDLENE